MNHLINPPTGNGRTFRLKTCGYNLSHDHGQWRLVRVTSGVLHEKAELVTKSDGAVFNYLAITERCTYEEARRAYEDTQTAV